MAFGAELATFVDILDFYLSDKINESRRELLESGGKISRNGHPWTRSRDHCPDDRCVERIVKD